jgi:L-fuculose-phosphate aldolase
LAKYATAGTEALAVATVEAFGNSNAIIMANHGIAAVGSTLDEAFNNALSVEFTARININARTLGTIAELPSGEVSGIRDYVLKKYGQK